MASSDYKLCDLCRGKVFYDANIKDERYCQTWGRKSNYDPIGLKAICGHCNKTHDVVIVPRTVDTQSSDLARPAPTLAEALAVPEIAATVEAARPFYAAVFNDNGDVTISTGHITTADWLRLDAALARITGEAKG